MKFFLAKNYISNIGLIQIIRDENYNIIKISINQNENEPKEWLKKSFYSANYSIITTEKDPFFEELGKYISGKITEIKENYLLHTNSEFIYQTLMIVKQIPYGRKMYYSEIAEKLGGRNYSRAVGMALAKNPLPILIPCHRVIPKNNKYPGKYTGGSKVKLMLLNLEKHHHKLRLMQTRDN